MRAPRSNQNAAAAAPLGAHTHPAGEPQGPPEVPGLPHCKRCRNGEQSGGVWEHAKKKKANAWESKAKPSRAGRNRGPLRGRPACLPACSPSPGAAATCAIFPSAALRVRVPPRRHLKGGLQRPAPGPGKGAGCSDRAAAAAAAAGAGPRERAAPKPGARKRGRRRRPASPERAPHAGRGVRTPATMGSERSAEPPAPSRRLVGSPHSG